MQAVAAALICTGAEESHLARIRNRLPYLCCPQLLPDPHINTPWQALYRSRNDHAYITTMGFDVETFELILSTGFTQKFTRPQFRETTLRLRVRLSIHELDLHNIACCVVQVAKTTSR